jgi:hypothetical protein
MDSGVENTVKFRELRTAFDEGMADVEAGRVVPWDLAEFLDEARVRAHVKSK